MVYRKPPTKRCAFQLIRGADGLTKYCQELMRRTRAPQSARDIVNAWYAEWRGRRDKPANMIGKARGWFIDRVSAWLRHHAEAGRLVVVDRNGERKATRYIEALGANWKRGKAAFPKHAGLD